MREFIVSRGTLRPQDLFESHTDASDYILESRANDLSEVVRDEAEVVLSEAVTLLHTYDIICDRYGENSQEAQDITEIMAEYLEYDIKPQIEEILPFSYCLTGSEGDGTLIYVAKRKDVSL